MSETGPENGTVRDESEDLEEHAEPAPASEGCGAVREEGTDAAADDAAEPDPDEAQEALEAARAEAATNYDRFLRATAELDNYRKRTAKVRTEAREVALRDVLLSIAPMLDNMRRALAQEPGDGEALKQGVELIQTQFQAALRGYGLEEIEAVGQPFDPELHEAMMEVEHDEQPPGTVVQEMERGYQLNNKVVRPARVIVSRAAADDG